MDLNGIIVSWNHGAGRLFGHTAEEAIGKPITILYPDNSHEAAEVLGRIRRGEQLARYETVRQRKDGSLVDISLTMSPVKNSENSVIGASKIAQNISDRKHSDALRTLMVDELNHRVKNTLAEVQSIAAQSLKGASDVGRRETFEFRLVALSRTHDLLARESWENVSLRELVLQQLEPYRAENGTSFAVEGPDLGLWPKAALTLGMAFHELATNAAKYGAFSKPAGQVQVTWHVLRASKSSTLRLKWEETGGPPVEKTERKGFGSTLIERGVSLELDGEVRVDFDSGGVVCTMEIPLPVARRAGD